MYKNFQWPELLRFNGWLLERKLCRQSGYEKRSDLLWNIKRYFFTVKTYI